MAQPPDDVWLRVIKHGNGNTRCFFVFPAINLEGISYMLPMKKSYISRWVFHMFPARNFHCSNFAGRFPKDHWSIELVRLLNISHTLWYPQFILAKCLVNFSRVTSVYGCLWYLLNLLPTFLGLKICLFRIDWLTVFVLLPNPNFSDVLICLICYNINML